MTRTTRLRRITLHLRQIFFTDASTFIFFSRCSVPTRLRRRATGIAEASDPCPLNLIPDNHFARKMILARDKSYGVSSTVTLSPGRILM